MSSPSDNKPLRYPAEFSTKTWAFLAVALVVAAFLSIGEHDLVDAHLGVPYPYADLVPSWALYIDLAVRIGAVAVISRLGSWFLDRRSPLAAATIVGVAIVMLHEAIRVLVVNIAMVDGYIGRRWLFMVIDAVPLGAKNFYMGVVGVLIARTTSASSNRKALLIGGSVVLMAAAVEQFGIQPLLQHATSASESALHLVQPPEVYQLPYGLYIYSFIYTMFLEPALAAFFLAFLIWPALPRTSGRAVAAFVLLLLVARGRIVMTGLFSFWIRQPILLAVAGEGQFFLETLILALFSGLAWSIATRPMLAESMHADVSGA